MRELDGVPLARIAGKNTGMDGEGERRTALGGCQREKRGAGQERRKTCKS